MKSRVDNPRQPRETGPVEDRSPASWVETLAGVALFLAFGAFLILEEIVSGWEAPGSIQLRNALFWILLLLPPSGVAIGWVRNFPRWSYPYAGLAVLTSMYMANASSPGLSLFGIPVFGRELWGWRALVPLLLASGTSLLVTRTFRPLYALIDRAARDLTLVTYGMFGGLPLWVFISFDEMDRRYSLSWMVVLALLIAGAVLAYLRSRSPQQRVVSLTAGILLSFAITTAVPTLYWLENGWVNVGLAIAMAVFLAAFMLAPAYFGLTRQTSGAGRA